MESFSSYPTRTVAPQPSHLYLLMVLIHEPFFTNVSEQSGHVNASGVSFNSSDKGMVVYSLEGLTGTHNLRKAKSFPT